MRYTKIINSGLLLFSLSTFAQMPITGSPMLEDRLAISQAQKSLGPGIRIEIYNAITQLEDGTLELKSRVTSEEVKAATDAILQRSEALKDAPIKKIFISSESFARSKKGITLAGQFPVEVIVANIDRLIEESKQAIVAAAEAEVIAKAAAEAAAIAREERIAKAYADAYAKSIADSKAAAEAAAAGITTEAPVETARVKNEAPKEDEVFVLEKFSVTASRVEDTNKIPLAQDISGEAHRNTEIKGGVTANDYDVDADIRNLNYKVVQDPENTENFYFDPSSGYFTLTPKKGYLGEISFSYQAMDAVNTSNTASVKINFIKPPKPAPTRMSERSDNDLSKERQVDLIFIVDSSGSMRSVQDKLLEAFTDFMSKFEKKNLDVNIAVLTTNGPNFDQAKGKGESYGAFIGSKLKYTNSDKVYSERFLKKGSPMLGEQFKSMALVGIEGDSDETALLPLAAALSEENLAGINQGFLRPDALLSIIIISDEDESRNTYGFRKGAYVINDKPEVEGTPSVIDQRIAAVEARLKTLKKNESGRYRMYSVGNSKGKAFAKTAQHFKGDVFDIESNFAKELMTIAEKVSTLASRQFALKDTTIADSIVVTVNGEQIVETRNTVDGDGFSYNSENHSVSLHGKALKDSVGGKVLITYDYLIEAREEN